jgi:hypothetical protein
MAEKCTEQLPLRIGERLLLDLSRLANNEDRSVSEYCRIILERHVYGHARRLEDAQAAGEACNAMQCSARSR